LRQGPRCRGRFRLYSRPFHGFVPTAHGFDIGGGGEAGAALRRRTDRPVWARCSGERALAGNVAGWWLSRGISPSCRRRKKELVPVTEFFGLPDAAGVNIFVFVGENDENLKYQGNRRQSGRERLRAGGCVQILTHAQLGFRALLPQSDRSPTHRSRSHKDFRDRSFTGVGEGVPA
jgi:hypothetical protein